MATVCARYIPDMDDRQDVLQESFIKIYSSINRFEYRGGGSLKAWMTRIVVNEALSQIRRESRLDLVQPMWELPDQVEDEPDLDQVPEDVLLEMIASLPVGYRTVLNLFAFEGKSHREIAQMLGIKESSSASQFHRAKDTLAKQIRAYKATQR